MTTDTKSILADPLASYARLHGNAHADTQRALAGLTAQAQTLAGQVRQIELDTKITSRLIGEARRAHAPVDALTTTMRDYSTRLGALKTQRQAVEKEILHFFDTHQHAPQALPASAGKSALRHTPGTVIDFSGISIRPLADDTNDSADWNQYVAQHPAACVHYRAEWRLIIQACYGHECYYFVARDQRNAIRGVLPLTRLNSRVFGDFLVSMPYFQRGGALADHAELEALLMQAANDCAARLGCRHIEYRDDVPREALPVQTHKVNMVLALPSTHAALWQSFSAKLRSQIRRPQREAVALRIGGAELLDDFYAIYSRNMRDLGSPAHARKFVAAMLEQFPQHSWLIVLYLHDRAVAAGLLLGHGDTLEIPLASTIRDVRHTSMNMLLYWEILKFAIDRSYQQFDFGRSSKDASTYRFKKQWGAEPRQLYWHYWLHASASVPSLNPDNPKYALVIRIWKKLPVWLTQWLGPHIVKYLP